MTSEATSTTFRRRAEKVIVPVVSASLGAAAMYAYARSQDHPPASPKQLLSQTEPCVSDSLRYKIGDDRFIITDARCRDDHSTKVDIMSTPNEATLGPLARVHSGVVFKAVCMAEGQSVGGSVSTARSNKWVYVSTGDEFGYVSTLDAIADSALKPCHNEQGSQDIVTASAR